jgi:hypothetical protein
MASVVKNVQRETKEIVTYSVKLSKDEAETLAYVLAKVGGTEEKSARGDTQGILNALAAEGVNYEKAKAYGQANGSIIFSDRPEPKRTNPFFAPPPNPFTSYLGIGREYR